MILPLFRMLKIRLVSEGGRLLAVALSKFGDKSILHCMFWKTAWGADNASSHLLTSEMYLYNAAMA